ncbi:peroxisomal biogenesis factor 11 [Pilobolus umbonatus]|nr:peroxisomal biogenesis factor 11 [Pilobolus umbonatus]
MVLTHSNVDAFNRFLASTVGREKLCRLVQYFARFYSFYLFRKGAPKDVIQRWVDLKTHLGNGRKFFRLLKPVEFAQTGIKSLAVKDDVLRYTAVVKQGGMFFYYLTEMLVLANSINFFKFEDIKKYSKIGQRCWMTALTASLISSIYKFTQLQRRQHMLEKTRKYIVNTKEKSDAQIADLKSQEKILAKDKLAVKFQFVQDSFDIIIPSTGLGFLNVDEGVVGIAGMITSLLGMRSQWNKVNK